jgi:myo-inositol-1(or 4)-monophosphatase
LSLQPWDVAAGTLIVSEAGGVLTNFNGAECTIYGQQILATNGRIHRDLIQLLTA